MGGLCSKRTTFRIATKSKTPFRQGEELDRLHLINVFVAVVDTNGFAGASRKLNLSPPAVTRAINELEAHLGVRLLTRTTRIGELPDSSMQATRVGRMRPLICAAPAYLEEHGEPKTPNVLAYKVAEHLREGPLKTVLSDFEPPALPVRSGSAARDAQYELDPCTPGTRTHHWTDCT